MTHTSILAILLIIALRGPLFAQQADLLFFNGKIFTSDTAQLYVQALAIKGNTILATGDDASVMKFAGKGTQTINLQGKTVVPGFNDAHDHLGWLAPGPRTFIPEFSFAGPPRSAVQDSLLKLVSRARPGQWLTGGIGLTVFSDPHLRKDWLDSLAPDNPVAIQLMWGHGSILNSKALTALGITDTMPDPINGWYERFPGSKRITGALLDGAQFGVWDALSAADPDQVIQALQNHAADQLQLGITSVQDMNSAMQTNTAKLIFSKVHLPVRTRIIQMPGSTEKGRILDEWKGFSGIKYGVDGTPLEQTALMCTPYPDKADWYGRLDYPVDTIRQMLVEAISSKRQLMLHVVGDSAIKLVLRMMKDLAAPSAWRGKRLRIEHGVGIRLPELQDLREMGIVVVNTPQYGMGIPLQSLVKAGVPVAVGPDAMINPFLAIKTMCTAQTDPRENLTIEQAVIAYTRTAAYSEFAERRKGSLTPGMLADLAVLSQDIFTVAPGRLDQTRSLLTVVDGKIVYAAEAGQLTALP
jgi:predicted amidohydrolase YtcJ